MNILTQHTRIIKLNKAVVAVVFLFSAQVFLAQSIVSKLKKEFTTKRIAVLELNALYTDIVFKSWDKDQIFVNAYVKGAAEDTEGLKEQVDLWEVQINENDSLLIISSDASRRPKRTVSTTAYNITGDISQEKLAQLMQAMMAPVLENVQNNPIPASLKSSLAQLQFDFNAYDKLGETYLKIWEYNLVKDLDPKSATEVRKWSKNATSNLQQVTNSNVVNEVLVPNNVVVNKPNYIQFSQTLSATSTVEVSSKKVLEVYVPLSAKLRFKTRYGKVSVINELANAKAEMKYTPFNAEKVSGVDTDLVVSFAPVSVNHWEAGNLSLGYVKKSTLNQVDDINLYAKSSRVQIESLSGKGTIESLFGMVNILKLDEKFSKLSLISKNSDIGITLPKSPYNFAYTGNRSRIEIPENTMQLTSLGDNYNQMLNGYSTSRNTDKEIQMSVANSQIFLR
ncbi:hypothetical protein [Aquimarina agarilytica]|uniref:hypothetical protein n=1 Tax=Aquimarina agarilytica TaxID=1087449 RepID=UPI00028800FE|nr:hypothetical protein [Aquimarina agarilytica]